MNGKTERRILQALFREALAGVEPRGAVSRALARPRVARFLQGAARVGVFACGKAASAMVRGVPLSLRRGALVVLPRGYPDRGLSSAEVLFSSHPEPDARSVRAARRAVMQLAQAMPDTPIIAMSADVTASCHAARAALARELGASAILVKPFNQHALLSAIHSVRA